MQKARKLQRLSIQISSTDVEVYSTLDDDTSKCHICGFDDKCLIIQKDMKRALLRKKRGLTSDPLRNCGREGTVFYLGDSVVKMLALNKDDHRARKKIWKHASRCNIGPKFIARWFTPFDFTFIDDDEEKTGWSGWSSIEVERLEPITLVDLDQVDNLIHKTALCGFLHIDPSLDNIMMNEKNYLFVDWEEASRFEPRIRTEECPFCLIAYTIMISKLAVSLRKDATEGFTEEERKELEHKYQRNIKKLHQDKHLKKYMRFFSEIVVPIKHKKEVQRILKLNDPISN